MLFRSSADDRVVAVSDPRAVTTRYHYDALGRLLETVSPDACRVRYEVDAAGNRVARRILRKGV